jgi:hypothetical protein
MPLEYIKINVIFLENTIKTNKFIAQLFEILKKYNKIFLLIEIMSVLYLGNLLILAYF